MGELDDILEEDRKANADEAVAASEGEAPAAPTEGPLTAQDALITGQDQPPQPQTEAPPTAADAFIDQTIANPPVAAAPAQQNAASLPGNVPNVTPTPSAPATPSLESVNTAETKANVDKAQANADLQVEEQARVAEHNAELDRIRAENARQDAIDQKSLQDRVNHYNANNQLRDPKESQSAMDRVTSKLAIAFGALGAGYSLAAGGSGKNVILDQVNDKLNRETERQKFNIQRESDDLVMARAGVRDAREARSKLLLDEDARDLSRRDENIAHARSILASKGMNDAQIEGDKNYLQLVAQRQATQRKIEDDRQKNRLIDSQINLNQAKGRKLAGVGTGGAASGTAAATAYKMFEDGSSPSQVQAYLTSKGVPQKQADKIIGEGFKNATSRRGDQRADIQERRTVDGELDNWAKENGIPELKKNYTELDKLDKSLSTGNKNGLTQALALMEFDKASKGGTATNASLQQVYGHIGGTWDNFMGLLSKAKDGGLGDAQSKTLIDAVQQAKAERQAQAAEKHDQWQTFARSGDSQYQTPTGRKAVNAKSDALFNQFGFKREEPGAKKEGPNPARALPPGAVPAVKDGRKGIILNGAFHAEQ
jgi:hypothetical protein